MSWSFNMVLELGLARGPGFKPPLCTLNILSTFVYLKVYNELCCLFDSPLALVWGRMHMRKDVKKHYIHIKPKSYKFRLLGELVV